VRTGQRDAGDVEIRPITEDEVGAWVLAMDSCFLMPTPDGGVDYSREFYLPGRSLGAFSGQRCVGTFRDLDLEITVPGGAFVPAEGITNVGVVADHRRRGLLTRMMLAGLDDAVRRGRSIAALIASEYRIYGRFGFGPATRTTGYDIDVRRAGRVRLPHGDQCSVEPVSLDEFRRCGPELHERFRRTCAGALARDQRSWRVLTGALRNPYRRRTALCAVVCRDADGTPAGLALFHSRGDWTDGDPDYALTVSDMFAAHPRATAALWHYLLGVEWVNRVTAESVAPDDPLPLLLDNPRACQLRTGSGSDDLWLRVLDVPQVLQARAYDAPGRLVLEVADRLGYATGTFALAVAADGTGSVTRTDEPADLALDVSVLGTLYLGDQTASRLAAAGLATEQRPGAAQRADRMLRTAFRPWCPDGF
jgi:predicted acetyltransferase